MRRSTLPIFLFLSFALLGARARADDKADAQALFDEGLKLFDRKEYQVACEKFAASQKADPAAATLLNLARCYEASGRTASAQRTYVDAIAQAKKENDKRRESLARGKEAELAPLIPHLTIVAPRDPNLTITRDGEPIDPAILGVSVAIDPGPHEVRATAPKKRPFSAQVTLAASEAKQVAIPELTDEAAPPPARVATPPPVEPGPPTLGTQRTIAIAVAGAGVLALGGGAFFGLRASSLQSDSKAHCSDDNRTCDMDGLSLVDRAGSAADVATIFFVAGGALLAAGVVLWLTAPKRTASVAVGPTGGSLRIVY